ncbi:hypothetical protein [Stenoxybacter acetivorans]|uniref:hypothetical protein n=1 Tax=Stenoxybacter acetivorans TaxID=422441 RepID=UPI00055EC446|nr:hypothetical protein [Stenoxybacter acetivorans]
MATILEQIRKDFDVHVMAWNGELKKLMNQETLTPEERSLLENRVHPILKEANVAIGAFISGIEISVNQALSSVKGQSGSFHFDQNFKNTITQSGKQLSQSTDNLLDCMTRLTALKNVLTSKTLVNAMEGFGKAIPGNLGKIFNNR